MGCRVFVHRFSRVFLFIINVFVALIGATALGVGIWGLTVDTEYTDIADGSDTNFNAYPILLIVVGCFILILGAVGFLGALCGDKAVGRVLLFVYGIVMAVIVLVAIAGAIAGYIRRDDIEEDFRENSERTLNETATNNRTDFLNIWNDVQIDVHCCGANSYSDWLNIDWYRGDNNPDNEPVIPVSCCATVGGCGPTDVIFPNSTFIVWDEGCVDAITDRISDQIGVIAGVSIAIAVLLIIAVVMAFFVAIVSRKGSSYEKSYV